jgi:TolB-like protein/DNA-binding winged helix-turn-helix (wHTH) protein/Flp pilus assembly protein TadD
VAVSPRLGDEMAREAAVVHIVRFGPYAADLRSRELYKFGIKLKLRDQSFQVLTMLLEHPGEVVTREELRQKLWPDETFVDFDHGLNAAVERLRRCLGDSASNPAFIETLPRRGYRFIGELAEPESQPGPAEVPQEPAQAVPAAGRRNVFPISFPKSFPMSVVALATVLLLLFLGIRLRRPSVVSVAPPRQTMLAVLPFENLSGDPNQDYFSDGLTEELITQLGALSPDRLGVIARTSSMVYKHTSKSARQIAGELGVDYVLESSVRRDGDQMRISVQLIRARDQVHVWVNSYDRQVSRSIVLQEEVAKAVAEQVEIKLSPAYRGPATPGHLDPQANEAYLRGLYFENQFTEVGLRKAITYFQQAIDRDPTFAEAYSGLADSYHFLVITDGMSPEEGEGKALSAARQAVALGEGLAEPHNALGGMMIAIYDWPQAESEFKRAIELNPSFSTEHRIYAALLATLGRHEEAWEQISQAMRTDPLSLPNNAEVVRTLYYARDYNRAIEQSKKAMQLDPDYYRTHFWLARVYAQKKMYTEAIAASAQVLKAMPDSCVGLTEMAYSLAAGGREAEAREMLRRLQEKSKRSFVPAYDVAVIHLALHEPDQAISYLQKAYQERDWALMVVAVEPRLDPLRQDPRFQELVGKVGLKQPGHFTQISTAFGSGHP